MIIRATQQRWLPVTPVLSRTYGSLYGSPFVLASNLTNAWKLELVNLLGRRNGGQIGGVDPPAAWAEPEPDRSEVKTEFD